MTENDNDFGFTFHTIGELNDVDSSKIKLEKIMALILPFLKNLKANPDKTYIKWEGRAEKVEALRNKIMEIYTSA